jgi:hypothetical protein
MYQGLFNPGALKIFPGRVESAQIQVPPLVPPE